MALTISEGSNVTIQMKTCPHRKFILKKLSSNRITLEDSGSSKAQLQLICGDISEKHTDSVGAVVNAANAKLLYGGGGTNQALSEVIDQKTWEAAASDYFLKNAIDFLVTSEVATCPWTLKKNHPENTAQAEYLFHCLGPLVSNDSDLDQAQVQVKQAYKNIFSKLDRLDLDSVQMPFLSMGIFASSLEPEKKELWQEKVYQATYSSILEAFDKYPKLRQVILVEKHLLPWENSIILYS